MQNALRVGCLIDKFKASNFGDLSNFDGNFLQFRGQIKDFDCIIGSAGGRLFLYGLYRKRNAPSVVSCRCGLEYRPGGREY
jgi:hypothetical protein